MAQQKIQLRKIRDFGENLSDTFQFIREELKPLVISFILVAGIFIVINAILTGLYEQQALGFMDDFGKGVFTIQSLSAVYTPLYFLTLLTAVIAFSAMFTVIAVYMKYYEENGTGPSVSDVWRGFTKYFLKVFVFGIIQSVVVIIGMIFCIAPGIYLLTVLMPYPFIIVIEERSIGETFNRCFEIVKENFWLSLGIYLVAGIIAGVCSGIIGLLLGLIAGAGSYFTTHELSSAAGIAVSIFKIVEHVFYIIFFISVALHYYNLVETREGTGLSKRLENLGKNANPNTGIEEQY
jgi:hypothetical protein